MCTTPREGEVHAADRPFGPATPSVRQTLASLDQWEALGWSSLVPALPTFGPASAPGALDAVVDAVVARPSVRGLVFWSWNSLDGHDDASIVRAAAKLARPAAPPSPVVI